MDIVEKVARAGGLLRLAPLVHNGLTIVDLPSTLHYYRGWLYLAEFVSLDQVRAAIYNAKLTCCSAAAHHGLPILHSDKSPRTHLAVPRNRSQQPSRLRRMDDVVIHRESTPLDSDPVRPWLASLPRVLERSCACLSPESAVAMLDFVTTNHLCDIAELHIPSFGPTSSRLQQAIKHSVRGSRSILETCARLQLEDAGIRVQVGVPIPGVGEVDMIVFDRLIIELDGWAFHKDKLQRARDLERDRRLVELGFLVVRFEYEAVMTNCTFVSEVLAMRDHALALERPALDYSSWSFL